MTYNTLNKPEEGEIGLMGSFDTLDCVARLCTRYHSLDKSPVGVILI